MKIIDPDIKVKELLNEFNSEKAIDICDAMIDACDDIDKAYSEFWCAVRNKLLEIKPKTNE